MQSSSPASLPELTPKQYRSPRAAGTSPGAYGRAARDLVPRGRAPSTEGEPHGLDDLSSLAEKGSKLASFLASVLAVVLVIVAFFDWKKVYNVIGIAHVDQISTVVRCAKADFEIGNIESNLLKISFTKEMCNGTFEKKRVLLGSLTIPVCGGIDNFQVSIDPLQVILRARDPKCASHKSTVEISYLVVEES